MTSLGLRGRLPAAQRFVLVRRAGHEGDQTGDGDGVARGGEEALEAERSGTRSKSWLFHGGFTNDL